MFLDKKTVLEIWLNPWLNITIFRGTGPRTLQTQVIGRKKGSEATVSISISKLLTSVRKVLGHIKSAKDGLKSI